MKRDFLTELGITDKEVIDKIMAENGKDITKEQQKFADYDAVKSELKKAQETIASFGDVDAIKADVEKYKAEAETTKKESEQKIRQMELAAKVKEFTGGKKFVNDLTREAIEAKMLEKLNADESKGKSFDDLFKGIIGESTNILVDENAPKPPVVTSMGGNPGAGVDGVTAAFGKLNPGLKID